jgi:predicted RNA polymerase sigma factor
MQFLLLIYHAEAEWNKLTPADMVPCTRITSISYRKSKIVALHRRQSAEAVSKAMQKWPLDGVPTNPRAWLVSTARNKAVDRPRRDRRFDTKRDEIARYTEATGQRALLLRPSTEGSALGFARQAGCPSVYR